MPCTLNKKAYERLIDEDISWLDNQPDTLEAKHIRQILEWIKTHRQLDLTERIKELEALRDTVSVSCNPPKDCNDPEVLKIYMKCCFDKSQKL